MKAVYFLAALSVAIASPIRHEKRDLPLPLGMIGRPGIDTTFDYIIVGGGTAGLTIAKRLAEDSSVKVAVVEAGTLYQISEPVIASTPGGDVTFIGTTEFEPTVDWGFFTNPDPASNNIKRSYARGKCLGGSSARNFMIYQRPSAGSLDRWAEETGDSSYTYANFLPYYQKSTSFNPPGPSRAENATAQYDAAAFPSTSGPLKISYPNYAQSFSSYVQGGLNEIGIPTVKDFNSGKLMGCQYCSTTIDPANEKRESSQTSFLSQAASENLTNLKIFTLTMAKSIVFDSNKKATGVKVVSASIIPYTLKATKEVILSAGAFQSPQLLMVSGVGPSDQLQKFKIPVVANLPGVGQNMQDHIFFGPAYRVQVETLTKLANNPAYLLQQISVYLTTGKGPLANNVADFLGWEKVPQDLRSSFTADALAELNALPADWPEIEYISGAGYIGDWSTLLFGQPKDGYQYATILAALVAPQSRGSVTLASSNASILPIINTPTLQSATDQQVAVAAYKRIRQAFASSFMQKIVIGEEYFPGAKAETDAQILETIKGSLQTVWHASSTCRMGPSSDSMAVVDSNARVYGVKGVRVVDASAFPFLPPGHPQSTIYALAEKIADSIKKGQ
ncbi:hypothetical protein V492_00582 [Pseudogymnoascus sp. VKM F-4246]|nr:hypothetical protein V492_00582 [Pseudogymnoascus sp. VKM F-4246]